LPRTLRDEIVDFITYWSTKSELPVKKLLAWLTLFPGRFYEWRRRYQTENKHNGSQPKNHWLLEWEKKEIQEYSKSHPLEGYRRLAFMMIDENIVAASPSSVYRVLKAANLLMQQEGKTSKKGTGFDQPKEPHEHWHIDVSYINIACTFFYFCSILDGYSRYIVHWELREQMKEADIEIILQRAKEKFPCVKPRVISDNGPQFIANDFKEFIRIMEMTHVKTSPYYPQSNGKIERWHRTFKSECVRKTYLSSLEQANLLMNGYIQHYNEKRLHGAIGYVTPFNKLLGREQQIFVERKLKLNRAQQNRLQVFSQIENIKYEKVEEYAVLG